MQRGHGPVGRFIARSLGAAASFLKEAVFSREISSRDGLLQRIDPRVKTLLFIAVVVGISFIRGLVPLAALYAVFLALAAASRIPLWYFIRRVWVFIPLFTLVIAVPSLIWYGPVPALRLVLRVADSVSFVTLVVLTTEKTRLFRSFAVLGVPRLFIQILDMMYTYLFLFIKNFEEMHLALTARVIRPLSPKRSRHWIASRISAFYLKSYSMSQQVYQAMLARGYTGDPKVPADE